jgi:hypothetical protein
MRFNTRRLVAIGISYLLVCGATQAWAQQLDSKVLDMTAREIQFKNQFVDSFTLDRDRAVIREVYPAIQADFKMKGFTEADASAAVSFGWKKLRIGAQSAMPFSKAAFQALVTKLGKVRIESTPPGATIEIDDIRQDETTDTAKWLAPGSYLFTLIKEGFLPREERHKVIEGENPPIRMTLIKRTN